MIEQEIPVCEKHISNMFAVTLIPLIKTSYKLVPATVFLLVSGAIFCPIYYPNYYPYQAEIYSIDMATISVVYAYLNYIYLISVFSTLNQRLVLVLNGLFF
jgi:hypothetical protein